MDNVFYMDEHRSKKQNEEKTIVFRNPEHERMTKLIDWLNLTPEQRMYPNNPEFWE